MAEFLQAAHTGLNNAYILFSAFLGIYAAVLAGRDVTISGNFWGAMWVNTFLAGGVLAVSILLLLLGEQAHRVVYYLYAVYFVISLPGLFAIQDGNDNRKAAFFYAVVALFNSAAASRAGTLLVEPWHYI